MIEILMLLGVFTIWFVLGIISSWVAFYKLNSKFGKCKYRVINNTGRERSRKKTLLLLLVMGPYFGYHAYRIISNTVEMHQGRIYLEEV